jgi:YgiT-type zinc finger domain-containing protein
MIRGAAPFRVDRNGYHLLLDAIPAWVCGKCNEAFFEESEATTIQEMVVFLDARVEAFEAPAKTRKKK